MTWLGPWLGWRRGSWDENWIGSDVWDPFGFGSSSERRDDTAALAGAHVDWRETDNFHIFRADVPGVRKEEVKVHVEDGNILQIDTWHRVERRRGSFVRRFRLPDNANLDDIKCSLEDGVLSVMVPKKETDQETRGNVRHIDID
ncbi:hypothetical protein L484_016466 [Morus notabilis]|uniref:SHSP domain-containing protein n=1 Tax=Morus notabilis TaxID=981085 RepID=W9RKR2_9ROSA|nr:17.4 kDa class I heat shock protein [Morus notabilis]EXB57413.1 hypothetical protein L484_016466 [Morus notabilis]